MLFDLILIIQLLQVKLFDSLSEFECHRCLSLIYLYFQSFPVREGVNAVLLIMIVFPLIIELIYNSLLLLRSVSKSKDYTHTAVSRSEPTSTDSSDR